MYGNDYNYQKQRTTGYQNNERERMNENLQKAFSLLDDDHYKQSQPSNIYGLSQQHRIGTAQPEIGFGGFGIGGSQNIRSNYTGSDFGDSEDQDTSIRGGSRFNANKQGAESNIYGVPQLGIQPSQTFGSQGVGNTSEIGTLNIAGSRRTGQRFIGGGSQASQRSVSDNRSSVGVNQNQQFGNVMGGSGGASLAAGQYSNHMVSKESQDLNFYQAPHQKSESITRSFGAGGGLQNAVGTNIGQLNKQNLGGLDNRRYQGGLQSDVGSIYRGGQEDDALSQYMGQSEFGGAPTEIGAQSLIGGQNTSGLGFAQINQLSSKPLNQGISSISQINQQKGKRQSEYKKDNNISSAANRHGESSLPPRDRGISGGRIQTANPQKENKNYGSFLQGLGGDSTKNVRNNTLDARKFGQEDKNNNMGFARDRSSRREREGENDTVSNVEAVSLGSQGANFNQYNFSPNKVGVGVATFSQGDQYTNRTQQNIHGTPQIGTQNFNQEQSQQKQPVYQNQEFAQLQQDLFQLKDRYRKIEQDWQKRIDEMKEQNHKNLKLLSEKQKGAENILQEQKDKIHESFEESIQKERQKLEEMHKLDLIEKEKQHAQNLIEQKKHLEMETKHLEEQLVQQSELKQVLDKLQQRTIDVSEIVQSSLKQRDEELKMREKDLLKAERDVQMELDTDVAIEEKKLEEEERKLQRMKEDMLRQKQNKYDELNRTRDHRKKTINSFNDNVIKYKSDYQKINQELQQQNRNIEDLNEKRKNKSKINDIEIENQENEIQNLNQRLKKLKKDFEQDIKERLLREIQVKQIEIEDKKKQNSNLEAELKKEYRMLEKKKELLISDREEMIKKQNDLKEEKQKFEETHAGIKQANQKLNIERDKIIYEKASYENEVLSIQKQKEDLEFQRTVLASEFLKSQEMEKELKQRANMLNIFQFSNDQKAIDLSQMPYYQLGFGFQNLPQHGKQIYEHVATTQNLLPDTKYQNTSFGVFQNKKQSLTKNSIIPSQLFSQNYNQITDPTNFRNQGVEDLYSQNQSPQRFNYDEYMDNLKKKIDDLQNTSYIRNTNIESTQQHKFGTPMPDSIHQQINQLGSPSPQILEQSKQQDQNLKKNAEFRERILAKLGQVEDSQDSQVYIYGNKENDYGEELSGEMDENFAEGLDVPSSEDDLMAHSEIRVGNHSAHQQANKQRQQFDQFSKQKY